MVSVEYLFNGNVTKFLVIGSLTVEELATHMEKYYPLVKKAIIWDFCKADTSSFTKVEMKKLSDLSSRLTHHERTALVGSDDLQMGLMRMYEVYAEMDKTPVSMMAFSTIEQAIDWVKEIAELGT